MQINRKRTRENKPKETERQKQSERGAETAKKEIDKAIETEIEIARIRIIARDKGAEKHKERKIQRE